MQIAGGTRSNGQPNNEALSPSTVHSYTPTLVHSYTRSLIRYLLPNACIVCERMVERSTPDELICAVCRTRLFAVRAGCERCSQPLPPVGPCRVCADWPAGLVRVRSAVWMDGEARALVHGLKYRGFQSLGERLAAEIAKRLAPVGDVIVPVPLGPGRLRSRGYKKASCIAQALGRRWGIPVVESILGRSRETGSQTELTPAARAANVSQAFAGGATPDEVGMRLGKSPLDLVLVDDVFTTGATIVAATDGLLAAGWGRVEGVTFARARTFESRVLRGYNV